MNNDKIAAAIDRNFSSPNVPDSNMEPACIVDVIHDLSNAIWRIAALYECELRQQYDIPADCRTNDDFRKLPMMGALRRP